MRQIMTVNNNVGYASCKSAKPHKFVQGFRALLNNSAWMLSFGLVLWHINHYWLFNAKSSLFIYIKYEVHKISFQTFFIEALLLIVHTWNSSPLRSNVLRLQCTCCIVPTTSGRPHGSPLVLACQWPSSQPLSSPQFSHNESHWA